MHNDDTIVARSTAAGAGAIAIVRVSGPSVRAIAQKLFPSKTLRPHRLTLGPLCDEHENLIDQGMAVLMPRPHSYTREDVLELHCHGGTHTVGRVLAACIACGARPALPGEFTYRAYSNGRIDLSQAQAVMDLISSQGEEASRLALERLEGGLSRRMAQLEDKLLDSAAALTAFLDYPDEDLEEITAQGTRERLLPIVKELSDAIDAAPSARRLAEGVRVAIAGAPNAGKSTLLNALLDEERAIVTDVPGTTRDTLTERMTIGGVSFLLTDTAGLREGADTVERIGIERAEKAIREADILLVCLDVSTQVPEAVATLLGDPRALVLLNKADLPPAWDVAELTQKNALPASALLREGLDDLRAALLDRSGTATAGDALLWHESEVQSAKDACAALVRALEALSTLTLDCALLDLQDALGALRAVTRTQDEAALERMFASFCLGK